MLMNPLELLWLLNMRHYFKDLAKFKIIPLSFHPTSTSLEIHQWCVLNFDQMKARMVIYKGKTSKVNHDISEQSILLISVSLQKQPFQKTKCN